MKFLLYLILLCLPFFIIILVNESPRAKPKPYLERGSETINDAMKDAYHCNWYCHNHTDFCIKTHNKWIKGDFYFFTNHIYQSIIDFLSSVKGAYAAMNVAFLVVGLPLLIWLLLINAIDKYLKIKLLKNERANKSNL